MEGGMWGEMGERDGLREGEMGGKEERWRDGKEET
jgi:hypothetical protein